MEMMSMLIIYLLFIGGDKTAIKSESGNVMDSGPNDRIFIFYIDHGGLGVLGEFNKTK
ncbi:unnamed protein product [Arabidopsis lyrata]|uniref:Dirigent protein n=1 Tax=Arabidopsis lyrata subsp. lyrata TaxID=81972 RepID=D7LY05_ARALL|nr:hypothetical protein ARALYDRAFT_911285 [Arabidopsis lyrata subsp. lyrata]CAH8272791.1 unnamed protein product [Arabidopsis lyrata]